MLTQSTAPRRRRSRPAAARQTAPVPSTDWTNIIDDDSLGPVHTL